MNLPITVRVFPGPFSSQFARVNEWIREPLLRRMGAVFAFLVAQNFGYSGTDRPEPWAPLSPGYAKRVKRSIATLEYRGNLVRSARLSSPHGDSITYSLDDEKASYHVEGNPAGNLPRRSPIPINIAGQLTSRAENKLRTAVELEIQRLMRGTTI